MHNHMDQKGRNYCICLEEFPPKAFTFMDHGALPATGACYARSRWPGASVTEWICVKRLCKSQDSEMGMAYNPHTVQHSTASM